MILLPPAHKDEIQHLQIFKIGAQNSHVPSYERRRVRGWGYFWALFNVKPAVVSHNFSLFSYVKLCRKNRQIEAKNWMMKNSKLQGVFADNFNLAGVGINVY